MKYIFIIFCLVLSGCGVLRDARSYRNYWVKNSVGFMCLQCAFNGRAERARMVAQGGEDRCFKCERGHSFWIFMDKFDSKEYYYHNEMRNLSQYKISVWIDDEYGIKP